MAEQTPQQIVAEFMLRQTDHQLTSKPGRHPLPWGRERTIWQAEDIIEELLRHGFQVVKLP